MGKFIIGIRIHLKNLVVFVVAFVFGCDIVQIVVSHTHTKSRPPLTLLRRGMKLVYVGWWFAFGECSFFYSEMKFWLGNNWL